MCLKRVPFQSTTSGGDLHLTMETTNSEFKLFQPNNDCDRVTKEPKRGLEMNPRKLGSLT